MTNFSRRTLFCLIPLAVVGIGGLSFLFTNKQKNYDIIVVGAGLSGLAAACSAVENHCSVLVLDKESNIGQSTHSDLGLFASSASPDGNPTPGDSIQRHFDDTFEAGEKIADPNLIKTFVSRCPSALLWLSSLGMKFEEKPLHSVSKFARCYQPIHTGYIETLYRHAAKMGVKFSFGVKVQQLISEGGKVVGVLAKDRDGKDLLFKATKGVILASGGFGANKEMVTKLAPQLKGLDSTDRPGSTGELISAAEKIGAATVDMEQIQCLPRPPGGLNTQGYLHLDASRFIYVTPEGRRFIQEDASRSALLKAYLERKLPFMYEISDDRTVRDYQKDIQRDLWRGIEQETVFKSDTLSGLAQKLGIDPKVLVKTVDDYNKACVQNKKENNTGFASPQKINDPPFWAVKVEMKIHETLGGLKINPMAQVINQQGDPIKGLWAAGSIVGGLHGKSRLGGNGIASSIVFGSIAGENCCGSGS